MTDGYAAAHSRVAKVRGRAGEYPCACGVRAQEWALTNLAGAVHGTRKKGKGRGVVQVQRAVWSDDPADYTPMCRVCHKTLDDRAPGTGHRHDPAVQRWYVRRAYYKSRGLDVSRAGPRPEPMDVATWPL